MRVEILVGNGTPVFHSINKKRMLIGSDPSCDIVVADPEVSRKHVLLITEKDGYFLLDQGSTNGSYLNEEQLVPGSRVEFTTYFPVRLGASVLLSLVENEDGEVEEDNIIPIIKAALAPLEETKPKPAPANRNPDATTVLSLKDLKEANTKNLVTRRQTLKKKEKKEKKTNKKLITPVRMYFIAILILGGSGYYTHLKNLEEAEEQKRSEIKASEQKKKEAVPVRAEPPKAQKATPEMITSLTALVNVPKCSTELEQGLCRVIQGADVLPWGVISSEGVYDIVLDGKTHYEHAKSLLADKAKSSADIWEVAVAYFISTGFKEGIDYTPYNAGILRFSFFTEDSGVKNLGAYMEVKPEALQAAKVLMVARRLENVSEVGAKAVSFGKDYYKLFIGMSN